MTHLNIPQVIVFLPLIPGAPQAEQRIRINGCVRDLCFNYLLNQFVISTYPPANHLIDDSIRVVHSLPQFPSNRSTPLYSGRTSALQSGCYKNKLIPNFFPYRSLGRDVCTCRPVDLFAKGAKRDSVSNATADMKRPPTSTAAQSVSETEWGMRSYLNGEGLQSSWFPFRPAHFSPHSTCQSSAPIKCTNSVSAIYLKVVAKMLLLLLCHSE